MSSASNQKQRKRKRQSDYEGRTELVIPTPSIDQVLQSLANNALASAAEPENVREDEESDVLNVDDDNELCILEDYASTSNPEKKTTLKSKTIRQSLPRKVNLSVVNKQAVFDRSTGKHLNGEKQSERSRKSSRLASNTVISSSNETTVAENLQSHTTKSKSASSGSGISTPNPPARLRRTLADMLLDLNNDSTSTSIAATSSLQADYESYGEDQSRYQPQPRVIHRLMRPFPGITSALTPMPMPPYYMHPSALTMPPPVTQQSPLFSHPQTVVQPISTRTPVLSSILSIANTACQQNGTTSSSALQSSATDKDNDIQVLDEDDEDAGVEEATPFCKNCATEIPLIVKRLDNLDGMVSRMVDLVKKELDCRKDADAHPSNQQHPTNSSSSSTTAETMPNNNTHLICAGTPLQQSADNPSLVLPPPPMPLYPHTHQIMGQQGRYNSTVSAIPNVVSEVRPRSSSGSSSRSNVSQRSVPRIGSQSKNNT